MLLYSLSGTISDYNLSWNGFDIFRMSSPLRPSGISNQWIWIAGILLYVNSVVNPIVYNATNPQCRQEYRRVLCCPCRQARSSTFMKRKHYEISSVAIELNSKDSWLWVSPHEVIASMKTCRNERVVCYPKQLGVRPFVLLLGTNKSNSNVYFATYVSV